MLVVAATIDEPEFSSAPPRLLFEGKYWGNPSWPSYGVSPDGRFLMIQRSDGSTFGGATPQQIQVVLNWFEELKRLAPME
jgi:hypothetical protein